jgi:nicotinic acid mononucleotide adenylyltransferase
MHVKMTPVDVSSTAIRQAVTQGQPISFGTSVGVAKIIADHHLYGAHQ